MNDSQKVAIITGAERGIGAGLAAAFRSGGYAVVATSRSIPAADEPDFLTVQGDIAEVDTATRVVEQALERFGRIDSLINNAGIYIGKPFTDYTLEDYAAITSVNLAGFFHITQNVLRQMAMRGSGHVVNISTSLVDHAHSARPCALAALTKGGLAAVARSLAIEYASRGVRVNAVALGVIRTPMNDPADRAAYERMAALHPLGRMGEISDVVDGILYLERATFVTGETLHIDGGQVAGHRCHLIRPRRPRARGYRRGGCVPEPTNTQKVKEKVMFQNILVAADGSRDADQALTQAIDLAESEHARLSLVTVVDPLPWGAYMAPGAPVGELTEDALAEGQAIIKQAADRVPAGLHATTRLLGDQPIQNALVRQITDGHHDLVVIGSRGRGEAPLAPAWQHQPLRPEPQPRPGTHRSRTTTSRRRDRHGHRRRIATTLTPRMTTDQKGSRVGGVGEHWILGLRCASWRPMRRASAVAGTASGLRVRWARHDSPSTRSFDDQVAWPAVNTSKRSVAELMRVAWRSVGQILERVAAEARLQVDLLDGLRRIGMDEDQPPQGPAVPDGRGRSSHRPLPVGRSRPRSPDRPGVLQTRSVKNAARTWRGSPRTWRAGEERAEQHPDPIDHSTRVRVVTRRPRSPRRRSFSSSAVPPTGC